MKFCQHYLYSRKDFAEFIESGALSELIPCFSRDPDADPGAPRHVQDNIRLRKEMLVRRLLEEDSVLYVCGDARNMARQGECDYETRFFEPAPAWRKRLIRFEKHYSLFFSDGHGDHVHL